MTHPTDFTGEDDLGMTNWVDLGDGHRFSFTAWRPDRALNPQYAHIPSEEHFGLVEQHHTPNGDLCEGGVTFDTPTARALNAMPNHVGGTAMWVVESLEPLTISPSLQCTVCPSHGFIRNGRWVRA